MSRFRYASAAALLVLAAGSAGPARADLEIRVTDGVHSGTANDLGTPGFAAFSGTIGNFNVTNAQGVGFPDIGSPSAPQLDLASFDFTTTAGGTLTVEVTETGFATAAVGMMFLSDITGVYGNSSATMNTYLDTTNADFGTGTPLSSGLFDNQSASTLLASVAGPYSLTEIVTVTAGAGSFSSIDAAIVAAPEPTSLTLLAAGLALLYMTGSAKLVAARSPRRVRV